MTDCDWSSDVCSSDLVLSAMCEETMFRMTFSLIFKGCFLLLYVRAALRFPGSEEVLSSLYIYSLPNGMIHFFSIPVGPVTIHSFSALYPSIHNDIIFFLKCQNSIEK